jgi:hypothetical protein
MVCFRKGAALMRGFIVKNPPQATIANLPIAVVPSNASTVTAAMPSLHDAEAILGTSGSEIFTGYLSDISEDELDGEGDGRSNSEVEDEGTIDSRGISTFSVDTHIPSITVVTVREPPALKRRKLTVPECTTRKLACKAQKVAHEKAL